MLAEVWVVDLELLCWYQPQNTIFSREAPRESVSVALTVPSRQSHPSDTGLFSSPHRMTGLSWAKPSG